MHLQSFDALVVTVAAVVVSMMTCVLANAPHEGVARPLLGWLRYLARVDVPGCFLRGWAGREWSAGHLLVLLLRLRLRRGQEAQDEASDVVFKELPRVVELLAEALGRLLRVAEVGA